MPFKYCIGRTLFSLLLQDIHLLMAKCYSKIVVVEGHMTLFLIMLTCEYTGMWLSSLWDYKY